MKKLITSVKQRIYLREIDFLRTLAPIIKFWIWILKTILIKLNLAEAHAPSEAVMKKI